MTGVAFSGRSCSGKTWLAQAVVRELAVHGQAAQVFSFASAIKREVFENYGLTKEDLGGVEAIIQYGDDKRRKDEYYWIRKVAKEIRLAQAEGVISIVDDVRFNTELSFLSDRRFYLIRMFSTLWLRRARLEARGSDPEFATSEIQSETELEGQSFNFHRRILSTDGDVRPNACAVARELLRFSPTKKGAHPIVRPI